VDPCFIHKQFVQRITYTKFALVPRSDINCCVI